MSKATSWTIGVILAAIAITLFVPPLPSTKRTAQRIQAVNVVTHVEFPASNTRMPAK